MDNLVIDVEFREQLFEDHRRPQQASRPLRQGSQRLYAALSTPAKQGVGGRRNRNSSPPGRASREGLALGCSSLLRARHTFRIPTMCEPDTGASKVVPTAGTPEPAIFARWHRAV